MLLLLYELQNSLGLGPVPSAEQIRWKTQKVLLCRSGSFKVIEVGINRKPVCDILLVINSTISELSQLTVQIVDTSRFYPFWGLRDNVRCSSWAYLKARSTLPINVNLTFFAKCYGWGATGENTSKIGDFAPTRSDWLKISGRRCRPHQSFLHEYLGQWIFTTLLQTVFTQRNLRFYMKTIILRFEWFRGNVRWSS